MQIDDDSHCAERARDEDASSWDIVHDPREWHPIRSPEQREAAAAELLERIENILDTSFRGWDTREQRPNDALLIWTEGEIQRLRRVQDEISHEIARLRDEDPGLVRAHGLDDSHIVIHERAYTLRDRLMETPSATLLGAAAKLRLVLDTEYGSSQGLMTIERNALLDVLLQVEREARRLEHAKALETRMEELRRRQAEIDASMARARSGTPAGDLPAEEGGAQS